MFKDGGVGGGVDVNDKMRKKQMKDGSSVPISSSSETQGQSVEPGEKAPHFRRTFSPSPTDCPWVSEDAISLKLK